MTIINIRILSHYYLESRAKFRIEINLHIVLFLYYSFFRNRLESIIINISIPSSLVCDYGLTTLYLEEGSEYNTNFVNACERNEVSS